MKHGLTNSREYVNWLQMKQRCYNKNSARYKNYGGRGITICDRWLNSFSNFIADMGFRPSPLHSLDRINNDGNYEPGNCRWATPVQQSRNKSSNVNVCIDGNIMCAVDFAKKSNVSSDAVYFRIKTGIPLSKPFRKRNRYGSSVSKLITDYLKIKPTDTIKNLSAKLNVKYNSLYTPIRELESKGIVRIVSKGVVELIKQN